MGTIAGAKDEEGQHAGSAPTPAELVERADLARHLRAIIDRLPDAERALIEAHYFGEETLERAAAALGLSKSWGSRLHARAIDAIAGELKKLL
jgi:RNA polymerase sigma factor for flagellar operon FliA